MDYLLQEQLPFVMEEIAQALGAAGVVLTLHPAAGPGTVVFGHADGIDGQGLTDLIAATFAQRWSSGEEHRWISLDGHPTFREAMLIPVHRVPDHSQLVISALFGELSAQAREEAEAAYRRRRPFAVGYFQLLQLQRSSERRIHALETALDKSALGVVLLDRAGQVIFANESARAILEDGSGLRRFGSSIQATRLVDSIRLRAMIEHVLSASVNASEHHLSVTRSPMISIERPSRLPLTVLIVPPLHHAQEPGDVGAMLYINDPAADTPQLIQVTCQLLGLSTVESRLAALLVAGQTLSAAAATMRLKEETVRTYLKRIFAKTDTNRQTDLILLILSSLVRTSRSVATEAFA